MSMMSVFAGGRPVAVPVRRATRRRLRDVTLGLLSAVGLAVLAGLLATGTFEPAESPVAPQEAPPPAWVDVGKPLRLFALPSTEFGREPRLYEARRHRNGGGRQDLLTYGQAFASGPYLRLGLYRLGAEEAPHVGFYLDLTRAAGLAGLSVTRSAQPAIMQTRFGDMDVADLVVSEGTVERNCLGFRAAFDHPGLRLTGFACSDAKPLDRAALACALDRLDLVSAGEDRAMADFFAAAEAGRGKGCATGKGEAGWLDSRGAAPKLRNAAANQKVIPPTRKGAVPATRSDLN